jgi:hypothetical protein
MDPRVVHNNCIAFWYFPKQTVFKPLFKEGAVCTLAVAFYGKMFFVAQAADYIYPFKFLSPLNILNNFPSGGAGIFAL